VQQPTRDVFLKLDEAVIKGNTN